MLKHAKQQLPTIIDIIKLKCFGSKYSKRSKQQLVDKLKYFKCVELIRQLMLTKLQLKFISPKNELKHWLEHVHVLKHLLMLEH